jgi:hypothetical protein
VVAAVAVVAVVAVVAWVHPRLFLFDSAENKQSVSTWFLSSWSTPVHTAILAYLASLGGPDRRGRHEQRRHRADAPLKHHDALEFPDGRIVLLTRLSEGQEATVLQLPAQPTTAAEADVQKRIAYVD